MRIYEEPKNTDWILRNSVNDVNYNSHLLGLTDEELFYCLAHEKRISSIKKLQREARRRLKRSEKGIE